MERHIALLLFKQFNKLSGKLETKIGKITHLKQGLRLYVPEVLSKIWLTPETDYVRFTICEGKLVIEKVVIKVE